MGASGRSADFQAMERQNLRRRDGYEGKYQRRVFDREFLCGHSATQGNSRLRSQRRSGESDPFDLGTESGTRMAQNAEIR